jgi:beta-mannosidase
MGRVPRASTPTSPTCYMDEHILLYLGLDNEAHEITPLRTQSLSDNWEWKRRPPGKEDFEALREEEGWRRTCVPTEVFEDLLEAGLIPDPFVDRNEVDVQWVGEADWVYRTRFPVEGTPKPGEKRVVVFEGLDTFARVYLNGELVLTSEVSRVVSVVDKEHVP